MAKISGKDVVFSQATSYEQLTEVWRLNAQQWANQVTVQEHIDREREMSRQPASGSRWRTWILTLKEDPKVIVSSLETFEHEIFVSDQNGCRKALGGKIASVFTNPTYRGTGMAALLLTNVKKWLDTEGNAFVSVLYSDIGPEYYAKLGWKPHSTRTLELVAEPRALPDVNLSNYSSTFSRLKPLYEKDVKEICNADIQRLDAQFKQYPKDGHTRFAFLPMFENICWHDKMEELCVKLASGTWEERWRGAVSSSGKTWIIWHFAGYENKLKVQRIATSHPTGSEEAVDEMADLIGFASWFGTHFNVSTMNIWNPTNDAEEAARSVAAKYGAQMSLKNREGSLPAARLRHDHDQNNLVWDLNEYYAWC